MFDASLPELVLVFVIALLVLGPQRLPKVAAELGKWVGRARRTATQLRRQLEREIELAEIQPPPPSQGSAGTGQSALSSLSPSAREMSDALADSAAGRIGPTADSGGNAATQVTDNQAPAMPGPGSGEATTVSARSEATTVPAPSETSEPPAAVAGDPAAPPAPAAAKAAGDHKR
jgi:sec-independent protein translocase protein TatB